jgi:hypothetical protein
MNGETKIITNSTTLVLLSLILSSSTVDLAISTTRTDQPIGNVTNTKYLAVTNHSFFEDLLFTIVNGTVINDSNNTVNSVEINVQFYDKNGELITSNSENARFVILAPGENSSFSVKSDLGEEVVQRYNVVPGGDIEEG